jgi:hypothetical protein
LAAAFAGTSGAADPVDFEKQVLPILKDRCLECHVKAFTDERGRLKKPKSGFRMDAAKFLIQGGDIQADEGKKAIEPGKSAESTLLTFASLPEEDEMAMPPKGDRLTTEQLELIKNWIDQGAKFGEWKGDESEE